MSPSWASLSAASLPSLLSALFVACLALVVGIAVVCLASKHIPQSKKIDLCYFNFPELLFSFFLPSRTPEKPMSCNTWHQPFNRLISSPSHSSKGTLLLIWNNISRHTAKAADTIFGKALILRYLNPTGKDTSGILNHWPPPAPAPPPPP